MVEYWALIKIGPTVGKMGCGKWNGLVAISVLFRVLAVIAQPGFLSISCGGNTTHTDENNITWVSDDNYIHVGVPVNTGNAFSKGSYLHNLRFFPKPLYKSCYDLPVAPDVPYLLRLWFAVENYRGFQDSSSFAFSFSIETLGMLAVQNISKTNMKNITPLNYEQVLLSSGRELYVCLIRTSDTNDPFISAIELRALRHGMYQQAKAGTMLSLISRWDVAGNSTVRYPQDEFDRLWSSDPGWWVSGPPRDPLRLVNSQEPISTNHTQDLPPSVVMQTARFSHQDCLFLNLIVPFDNTKSLLLLYFANIVQVNMSFDVIINGNKSTNIDMAQNYFALERPFLLNDKQYTVQISRINQSIRSTILNALEFYAMFDTQRATYSKDIDALEALKMRFGITEWISDPCYLIEWNGIGCDNNSSSIRISEINLSGRKLTGPVPENLGELTALVNMSLDNNHLQGPLPDFSNLTRLERLHLQNNNLTGRIPDWLWGLENLRELFVENNNFSDRIPFQLLHKPSLTFRYSGNPYLLKPSNPEKTRMMLIIGITLSGSLIIGLVLIVIIVIRRKKIRRKESSGVEKESKHVVNEDNSGFIMPNTENSRAYTLGEIREATQNFGEKIGQGGFGSVFFGKLTEGKDIAVKVLSLYSKQGIQEFLNEIDLLSIVHHKNLVSLLGYCKESRRLMLVYEHMPGGSLRDHLYGPLAGYSQLNWLTRLKIASDAAQGLEYLHVGCTPKIIHRDVKSANILLDKNFNGKLADFGLSRMTIDGEVSHITTTVKGTLGYLDPEYFSTQMLTEKSDVYSFGVVLLEIICGRQPINSKLPGGQMNLIRWVTPYVEMDDAPGKIEEIIDKRLGRNYDIKSITGVAKLAIRCVQAEPSSRPTVSEIVAELDEYIKLEKDNASLISEIDVEYGDLDARSVYSSLDSSGPRDIDFGERSSKLRISRKG